MSQVRIITEIDNTGVAPVNIYEDVAQLQEQVNGILEQLENLQSDFVPENSTDLNGLDLNEQIGKIIIGYGNNCINKPAGHNGYLINIPHNSAPELFGKQIWLSRPSNNVFVRNLESGTWGEWTSINYDTGWITLPLQNGAVAYNSAQTPQYRKINNQVYIRGVFKGITARGTIAILPSNYRPSQRIMFNLLRTGYTTTRFEIETTGEINYIGSGDAIVSDTWFSFSDTSFFID